MNRILVALTLSFVTFTGIAQSNYNVIDPEKQYKEAKDYFAKGDYTLAYPLLKSLLLKYPENTKSDHAYINEDIHFFYIVTTLKLEQPIAEENARRFIETATNEPRSQMMSFHLARYYFIKNDYEHAIEYYERAGYDNLTNDELADAKFELAYSYFQTGQNGQAKPLFNEIHQLEDNKYYYDANYYYGYLSFQDKNYREAFNAFKKVESVPKYESAVPYYIAQLYYFQGKKDEALSYAEGALAKGNITNSKDLSLLAGQIYFEKKQFAKALPHIESYVNKSDKVSQQVMYELSYCYYEANQVDKAIEGFKQLSNEKDSLGQNSMYLLGDLYLKSNQKVNARNAFKYSADNNSNRQQQEISRFNYAKLSYELGYNDIAMADMNKFLTTYPSSVYSNEGKEILINLLSNSNNYNEALTMYRSFETPTPTMARIYPKIIFGLAVQYINQQKLNEADKLLTEVTHNSQSGSLAGIANFWRAEIAYRLGRYPEAIQLMNNYLVSGGTQGEANPTNARYVLGYGYLQTENFPKAVDNFRMVAPSLMTTSNNMEQDAYVRTADAYFMQRQYSTAKSMYQNVVNGAMSQSDYALYQLALIDGINNPSERISKFNALVQRYPQSDLAAESYMQIANTYMAQEKFADAIPYLNKVLNISSASGQFPKVYLKLGLSNYNLNNNNEAMTQYQKLVKLYPQSAEADEALDYIKNIYVEQGKPNEYVDFLKKSGKSISISEADSLTYAAAEMQFENGDCAAAINSFNNYLTKFPQGASLLNAYFYQSECYSKNKNWNNAIKGYEAIVNAGNNPFAERAALEAARINYFELKDYALAKNFFTKLREFATTPQNELEALRGLTRSYYQTKDFTNANTAAKELLTKKGISTDDKAIANLVLAKSYQNSNQCDKAIDAFKQVAAVNKSDWGAEARYEIANCYYSMNDLKTAEKSAMDVIKTAGVDYWIAKSYILLGDIYLTQKDYFNAKATFKSVADNATIEELKKEARDKYEIALKQEQAGSKVESKPAGK